MKKLVACIILGFITTVGVSWLCALWSERSWGSVFEAEAPLNEREGMSWIAPLTTGAKLSQKTDGFGIAEVWTGRPFSSRYRDAIERPKSRSGRFEIFNFRLLLSYGSTMQCTAGWPVLALIGEQQIGQIHEDSAKHSINGHVLSTEFAISIKQNPDDYGYHRILPFKPIWPGFAINMVFYSTIWFGLIVGLPYCRRKFRCHKGNCPKCAYNLRSDFEIGCPECGWGRDDLITPFSPR